MSCLNTKECKKCGQANYACKTACIVVRVLRKADHGKRLKRTDSRLATVVVDHVAPHNKQAMLLVMVGRLALPKKRAVLIVTVGRLALTKKRAMLLVTVGCLVLPKKRAMLLVVVDLVARLKGLHLMIPFSYLLNGITQKIL